MNLSDPELKTVLRCVDKVFDFSAERDRLRDLLATLEAENKALRERNAKLECCVDAAWGIIANAGGGDWNTQTPEWKEAAESWRDNQFHPIIKDVAAVNAKAEGWTR